MTLADLWLPMVVSAVAVFVVSSLVHMVFKYHNSDHGKLPDEDRVLDALRGASIPRGQYRFPYADTMKDMQSPEMKAKFERGPVGMLNVMAKGGCSIGPSLLQWFILTLVVSAGIGCVAGMSLRAGAPGADIFRLTSTIGVLAYGAGTVCDSIWKGVSWGVSMKFLLDAVLYAAATGAVFVWMWPAA